MPKLSRAISCKLNKKFYDAKDRTQLEECNGTWSYKMTTICRAQQYSKEPACCGLDELSFLSLNWDSHRVLTLPDEVFEELIAKYISIDPPDDHRIVFVGIPTRVGILSEYDIRFYRKLRRTLQSFGFVELSKRGYRNNNSDNIIIAMAGQF